MTDKRIPPDPAGLESTFIRRALACDLIEVIFKDGRHTEMNYLCKCCFLYKLIAPEQQLRQNEHDKKQRDEGAPAECDADVGDGGLGGQKSDEQTRNGKDAAGSDERGQSAVECGGDRRTLGVVLPQGDIAV